MRDAVTPLPFHAEDLELLTPKELSLQLRVSRAFVQLCLDAGCPTRRGKASAAELLHWLFQHYPAVRDLAGLSPVGEVDGIPRSVARRLKMANALLTLLEYTESRASDRGAKRALRQVRRSVEGVLERG